MPFRAVISRWDAGRCEQRLLGTAVGFLEPVSQPPQHDRATANCQRREELSSTTTGVTTDPCCSIEITSRYVGLSNSSDAAANCCRRSSIAALGRILAQEVFLPTLKYPPTYRDDGRFETWLFRIGIARNARADDCRKRTRAMPLTDEALGQPVPDAGPVLHHRMWPTRGATAGGHQADRTHRGSVVGSGQQVAAVGRVQVVVEAPPPCRDPPASETAPV